MKINILHINKLHYYLTLILLLDKSVSEAALLKNLPKLQPRIYGGIQAVKHHHFTYQVSLRRLEPSPGGIMRTSHFCGGALISDRWIVSAAHCTSGRHENYTMTVIVLGAYHLYERDDGVWYRYETVINHPKHSYDLHLNDISLIKTDKRVQFTNEIRPIRLSSEIVNGGYGVISGWGVEQDGYNPLHLLYLPVEIIGHEKCISSHKEKQYADFVYNTTLCTMGIEKKGVCHGDSGGPLVKNDYLIGVVSWGVPCGLGVPDQHTRISSYLKWINENTGIVAV